MVLWWWVQPTIPAVNVVLCNVWTAAGSFADAGHTVRLTDPTFRRADQTALSSVDQPVEERLVGQLSSLQEVRIHPKRPLGIA